MDKVMCPLVTIGSYETLQTMGFFHGINHRTIYQLAQDFFHAQSFHRWFVRSWGTAFGPLPLWAWRTQGHSSRLQWRPSSRASWPFKGGSHWFSGATEEPPIISEIRKGTSMPTSWTRGDGHSFFLSGERRDSWRGVFPSPFSWETSGNLPWEAGKSSMFFPCTV